MKQYLIVLLASYFIVMANAASAEAFYAGGALLSTKTDTGITPVSGSTSLDEKDSGFKVFAGYEIDKNLSIEGFYVDYGEITLTGNAGDTFTEDGVLYNFTANNVKLTGKTTGFGFSGKYAFPITDAFDIYAKLGLLRWDIETTTTATGISPISTSKSGTDIILGLGASVAITEQFSLFADYEITKVDDDDVTVFGVGAAVGF